MNVFEWKWNETKRNERKCAEMKRGKSKCMFLWCHSVFWNNLSFAAIFISFQFISSFSFHYLPLAIISMQYAVTFISLLATLFTSFHFSSSHLISFQIHSSSLFSIFFRWLNNLFRMIRAIKHSYGPQSILTIWTVSLSKLLR
jgi:hypothetical protein